MDLQRPLLQGLLEAAGSLLVYDFSRSKGLNSDNILLEAMRLHRALMLVSNYHHMIF
jgi:hypothetical protein